MPVELSHILEANSKKFLTNRLHLASGIIMAFRLCEPYFKIEIQPSWLPNKYYIDTITEPEHVPIGQKRAPEHCVQLCTTQIVIFGLSHVLFLINTGREVGSDVQITRLAGGELLL